MKWLQEWYEIWWLCCIKAAFPCENSPVKIPLSGAMHVNLQNNHSLHRKGLREFHSWSPWEFLLSTSPAHGREGCLETVKAVLHSQLPAATSAHHQSSGFSLCWPELPSRSSMSRCFLHTWPAKRFLLDVHSYITVYPANQAICLVASQEGVVREKLELLLTKLVWVWLSQPGRVFPASWTCPLVVPWIKAGTDP